MLFTMDRIQIVNGSLLVLEFFNHGTEHSLINFNKLKKSLLRILFFCNKHYGIGYKTNEGIFTINEYDFLNFENQTYHFGCVQYQTFFKKLKGLNLLSVLLSKPLSSKITNIGEAMEKIVIEFLKRENKNLTDLTVHSIRYPWN